MDTREDGAEEVRVQFYTNNQRYAVTDTPVAVPVSVRRSQLSQMINHLLQLDTPCPFDFLINAEFLRTSIGGYLEQRGMSTEELIRIEYLPALPPPVPGNSYQNNDWVSSVACHPVRSAILAGSYDGTVAIWNHSGEKVGTCAGHSDIVRDVAWVPGPPDSTDDLLVSGSQDETVRLWQVDVAKRSSPTKLFIGRGHLAAVNAVAAQPTGKLVCSGSADRSLRIWRTDPTEDDLVQVQQPATGKRRKVAPETTTRSIATLTGSTAAVQCMCWHERGTITSAGDDHCVRYWDVQTGTNTATLTGSKVITDISRNSSTGLVAASEFDGGIRVYSNEEGSAVIKVVLSSHKSPASSVCWSPTNSHQLVSASYDGKPHNLKLWDVRSPTIPVHNIGSHDDKVFSVDWVQPQVIVSGSADKEVKLFSLET